MQYIVRLKSKDIVTLKCTSITILFYNDTFHIQYLPNPILSIARLPPNFK